MMYIKEVRNRALKAGLEYGFNIMLWVSSLLLIRRLIQSRPLYRKKLDYDRTFDELIRRVVANYESMFQSTVPVETDSLGKGITKKLLNQFGYVMIELKHYARDSLRAMSLPCQFPDQSGCWVAGWQGSSVGGRKGGDLGDLMI